MRAIIVGASGRMGKQLLSMQNRDFFVCAAADKDNPICNESEKADVIIEFAHASATIETMRYAIEKALPVVVGTTGHGEAERKAIESAAAHVAVFYAPNFSVGIAALGEAAMLVKKLLSDAEISVVETHRRGKKDMPSGTAVLLAERLSTNNVFSLRIGEEKGRHDVVFSLPDQTLTLSHTAQSRSAFASGAIAAARFIMSREKGLFGMEDMLRED